MPRYKCVTKKPLSKTFLPLKETFFNFFPIILHFLANRDLCARKYHSKPLISLTGPVLSSTRGERSRTGSGSNPSIRSDSLLASVIFCKRVSSSLA